MSNKKPYSEMNDMLKTKGSDVEKYPDHLKTHPEAKKEIDPETPMEGNLKQDSRPATEYPDNLKTNPKPL